MQKAKWRNQCLSVWAAGDGYKGRKSLLFGLFFFLFFFLSSCVSFWSCLFASGGYDRDGDEDEEVCCGVAMVLLSEELSPSCNVDAGVVD